MRNKFMCPMMQMHMAGPMTMPETEEMQMPMMQMPMMQMQMPMPMMQGMQMPMMDMDMVHHQEDEEDDDYFAEMYSDASKKMMPYVKSAVDKMEKKNDKIYTSYPDRESINIMIESTYRIMIGEMPDMAEEEDGRQFGRRRFARDLLGLLLLGELGRRRRRFRRRRPHYGYGYPSYGYGDYYYYD